MFQPEIWGGIECTINRVGNTYYDQLALSGHYNRGGDIQAIASLGIKTLRYPILWEKHEPVNGQDIDWSFVNKRLGEMEAHGINVIAGLVHHGCGPLSVNFFDGSFEDGLQCYAAKVANQFPQIKYYTPVNEPLTTARFSGLYGHWYPHGNDDYSFCKILLSECKATIMAMEAIRKITPDAKLIQTEDLGKTFSTPLLKYQADFENHRRWLSFDLINEGFTRSHVLWEYFIESGIQDSELQYFVDNSCAIDVLGLNYYITSERYLDERLEFFPPHTHGGNVIHQYADVEVVRVRVDQPTGFKTLVNEAWKRYRLPIAITEVHIHCQEQEQCIWIDEILKASMELEKNGVAILAVTAWAILGAQGWDKLLCEGEGTYEPGVFDVHSGQLWETGLSKLIKHYNQIYRFDTQLSGYSAWWKSDSRILYRLAEELAFE